jgi:glycyl-tRNA synthetase beta chain
MSDTLPFLFELGVEEIPHWMIEPALADLDRLFQQFLNQNGFQAGAVRLDGTPRRLVLRTELPERQEDRREVVMGPPQKAGPGAAQGFARRNNIAVESLAVETTPKGEYYALHRTVTGRDTRELLADALPAIITKLPWPKAMYWTGKGQLTFIRPIRWIVALLGDQVVEFGIADVKSGALSRGHRRMGADEIAFDHTNYEERLEKNGVILSAAKRRKRIQDGIKKLLRGTGLKLVADDALLSDLVYLTEFPTPILGEFREEFLELPAEVLSTVMRHHQRYFTLNDAEGKMAPRFIATMNMKADRKGLVKKGNERVLEARFNDARFFWEQDLQRTLEQRVADLASVTFQARLGSYLEKTTRVERRVSEIGTALGIDASFAVRAARIAKTDLTTEMVKELTELQGVMGGLYARKQGEPDEVWQAVYEQYQPVSMEAPIPASKSGQLLSLADKLDTLESCFSIGMIPSGSRDPFALRRAAQGVVKILVEGRLRLAVKDLRPDLYEFLLDRARYYFKDVRGFAYDELSAVLAAQSSDLVDVEARLIALKQVRQTENFEALAASFKRIRNILKQAGEYRDTVEESLFEDGAERDLHNAMSGVLARVAAFLKSDDYIQALTVISTLRPAVDAFFEKVLVNAPDLAVRANRLALLGRLNAQVSSIAELSEIVTSSTSE